MRSYETQGRETPPREDRCMNKVILKGVQILDGLEERYGTAKAVVIVVSACVAFAVPFSIAIALALQALGVEL